MQRTPRYRLVSMPGIAGAASLIWNVRHIGISRAERAKTKSRKDDMIIASPVLFFLTHAL
jgi:hypothetical protein